MEEEEIGLYSAGVQAENEAQIKNSEAEFSKQVAELMQDALNQWGRESQLDMVIEECAELIDAIQKSKRGRVSLQKLVEEGVDVEIMIGQLKVITEMPGLWSEIRANKLNRLEGLLE